MKSNSVCNIIAELSRPRERVQRSTTSKKIYLSTHPRKFGYDVMQCTPSFRTPFGGEGWESAVRPSGGGVCYILSAGKSAMYLCNICVFVRFLLAGNRAAQEMV